MISAQTLCVCREGKPVPTFPDHARGSAFLWVLPFLMGRSVCILPKFKSGNGAIMDLVRPVGEAHRAHRGVVARKARIVGNASGASSKPNTGSIFSTLMPLVSSGTRICDCC